METLLMTTIVSLVSIYESIIPITDITIDIIECYSSCKVSGKCTDNDADDCCPVYDNGVCANSCPVNFAPDENDFYQCGMLFVHYFSNMLP